MIQEIIVDIYDIEWAEEEVDECDWFCDSCNDLLNDQTGFSYDCGTWTCKKCGHLNYINSANIVYPTVPNNVDSVSFFCDENELRREISDYLEITYGRYPENFGFTITNDIKEIDDDFELANFCHGGDLTDDQILDGRTNLLNAPIISAIFE